MDTREIPFVARALAFAKAQQSEPVLTLGQDAKALADLLRAVNKNRIVVTVTLECQKAHDFDSPSAPTPGTSLHKLFLETITETYNCHNFQLLICTGSPQLTGVPNLRRTLRYLSLSSAPGSRIVIEMYQACVDDQKLEHWSQTERRYRRAVQRTGFQLGEINGVAREDDFPTTIVDLHAFTVSLLDAATSIETADALGSDTLRRVSKSQRASLKAASRKDKKHVVKKSLECLLGGRRRRLFATLRTSD